MSKKILLTPDEYTAVPGYIPPPDYFDDTPCDEDPEEAIKNLPPAIPLKELIDDAVKESGCESFQEFIIKGKIELGMDPYDSKDQSLGEIPSVYEMILLSRDEDEESKKKFNRRLKIYKLNSVLDYIRDFLEDLVEYLDTDGKWINPQEDHVSDFHKIESFINEYNDEGNEEIATTIKEIKLLFDQVKSILKKAEKIQEESQRKIDEYVKKYEHLKPKN